MVVVDTKNPGWGKPILDKIRELTDKPVTTIINTHTHGDHVSGNVEFPATVDVVTHENTKANMAKMLAPSGFPPSTATQTIFETNGGRGLPKRTFTDKMTIGSGNDQIDLRYFGRGHTNGDAWVVFPALKVMHAGDIFSGKNVPLLDAINGGSGVDMPETLSKAADFATNNDRHDHHRSQHADDGRRPARVLGLQSGFPQCGTGGEEGWHHRRRPGGELESAREVHRVRDASGSASEEQHRGGPGRAEVQLEYRSDPI